MIFRLFWFWQVAKKCKEMQVSGALLGAPNIFLEKVHLGFFCIGLQRFALLSDWIKCNL